MKIKKRFNLAPKDTTYKCIEDIFPFIDITDHVGIIDTQEKYQDYITWFGQLCYNKIYTYDTQKEIATKGIKCKKCVVDTNGLYTLEIWHICELNEDVCIMSKIIGLDYEGNLVHYGMHIPKDWEKNQFLMNRLKKEEQK